MRTTFFILILIHGLIHLMGFSKAFGLSELKELTLPISKTMGVFWLLGATLFALMAILFITENERWWIPAFLSILISQILIFYFWKDAKFGTIPNILILLVALVSYGKFQFHKMVSTERQAIFETVKPIESNIITEKDVTHLPMIVQKWLSNAGVLGKINIQKVELTQIGEMRMKPESDWMKFKANQVFNVQNPSFIWDVEVAMMPILQLGGLDKFQDGQGEMLIKLGYLFNVVNEGKNEQINTASMVRYLAEIMWFPSAALSPYLKWESINETSAKAIMSYKDLDVEGTFEFSESGEVISFSALRYYDSGKEAKLEEWFIENLGYTNLNGYRIPNQ